MSGMSPVRQLSLKSGYFLEFLLAFVPGLQKGMKETTLDGESFAVISMGR
jgi:hypothetical protein